MTRPPLFRQGHELPVLWENALYSVINKPSGLAVHPGPRTTDSVESRLVPQKRGGPWLVHRLDTDTAGCLLIARRKTALLAAQQAFMHHQTRKIYWAIVEGTPSDTQGIITTPLRRINTSQGWRMETCTPTASDALTAHTSWRILGKQNRLSWLELTLLTGRTHQARLHCTSLGTPVLGDPLYGTQHPPAYPMQLLARFLHVSLSNNLIITATAPPEPTMAKLLAAMNPDFCPNAPNRQDPSTRVQQPS